MYRLLLLWQAFLLYIKKKWNLGAITLSDIFYLVRNDRFECAPVVMGNLTAETVMCVQ